MAEKVTIMVLKVDLECPCCYKKVKKILCKFPREIRDQIFNEKTNTVRITVVCCSPEKIRDKLCCKGSKVIKSIEIVDPPKPEKPKVVVIEAPKKPEKKVAFIVPPKEPKEKPLPLPLPPPQPKRGPAPTPTPTSPPPEPIMGPGTFQPCWYPPVFPTRTCCGPCSEGYGGGPCYFGYGGVPPPPQQPCYDGHAYGYRPCHVTRCDYYFSEENPQACSIM